jgi:hypothetical protein
LLVGQRAGHRNHVDPCRGRNGLRAPRASGILETRSAQRQGAPSPCADREVGTPQLAADVQVGWLVDRGRPSDDAGSQGQCLRGRMGSDPRVQLLPGVLRYNNAGSNRRWHRVPPCHKAVRTHLAIAPYSLE